MLLLLFALSSLVSDAGDRWPDFRGPSWDGHVPSAAKPPLAWSEDDNVVWKTAIHGRGWSTPVVWDGQIWITTATETGDELSALALDAETGEVLFDRVLFEVEDPKVWRNKMNSHASPSPVIETGRVYIHFGTNGTACLDTESFEVLWRRRDINCDHMEGAGSSPILFEDLLIFNADGGDVQFVIALDKETGETAWKTDRSTDYGELIPDMRKAYSTPIVLDAGGRTELVSSGAVSTMGYDPRSGEELWRVDHSGFSMSSRSVHQDGVVFVNTGFMQAQLWAVRAGELGADEERVAWRVKRGIPTILSPVLVDGRLYFVNDSSIAVCLDAETGEEVWRERLGGEFAASPIYAAGRLYFFDRDGKTTVLKPGPEFEKLAENDLGDGFLASPAVVGDALILRSKSHLYRVEER
ncbi:MAG: PQQ-binding-like beta-propeller repeat protein [Planctomycetota bacterium]